MTKTHVLQSTPPPPRKTAKVMMIKNSDPKREIENWSRGDYVGSRGKCLLI